MHKHVLKHSGVLGLCLVMLLAGCLSGGDRTHPMVAALVGRTVIYDLSQADAQDAAKGDRFAPVPMRQSWAADGTTVLHRHAGLLVRWKTRPVKGHWQVRGRSLYCQTFRDNARERADPKAWTCYRMSLKDGGRRLELKVPDRGWFIDFRRDYRGRFAP